MLVNRRYDETDEATVAFLVGSDVDDDQRISCSRSLSDRGGEIRWVNHAVRARQLRHLMRERVDDLPEGTRLVVRASSKALGVPSTELGTHLDRVMERAWRKWNAR